MKEELLAVMGVSLQNLEKAHNDTLHMIHCAEAEYMDLMQCPSRDSKINDRISDKYELDASDRNAVRAELAQCREHWNYLKGHSECEEVEIDVLRRWLRNYGYR